MGVLTIGLVIAASLLSTPGAVQYIDLHEDWSVESKGPWTSRVDHRELLAMHHPWVPSASGNFVMVSRDVAVPDDWGNSVTLVFYSTDDYHGVPRESMPGSGFVGHRRRQILVNSVPVWSVDVSDAVMPGTPAPHRVTIPVSPTDRTLHLALLAYDAVASTEHTSDDFYQPLKAGQSRDTDPDAARFRTTIYWGDLALVSEGTELPVRPRPSEGLVVKRHTRTWPPEPDRERWAKNSPKFKISAPGGIPDEGFPLEMGIPLPEGVVAEPEAFRIADGRQRALYAQKNVLSTWPDGSLRLVLTQFPVKETTKEVSLAFSKDSARSPASVAVKDKDNGLEILSGLVGLTVGPGDPVTEISFKNKKVFDRIRLTMDVAGQLVTGSNDDWQVVEEGPFHTRLLLQGRFESLDATLGSYALYCSVYQGLPYAKFWFRYFNDTDRTQAVSKLDVTFDLVAPLKSPLLPHGVVESPFQLEQMAPDTYRVGDTAYPVEKPAFFQWSQGALVVKDFSMLHPKALRLDDERLVLSLVAGGTSPVSFTPGEAKSHEIWLALGPIDGAQLAATVAQPPLLDNIAYYGQSGAFGPAAPLGEDNVWVKFLQATYGTKDWAALGNATGVRHYPDDYYLGNSGKWSNNYDDRMTSLWSTWLATGDRLWYDRAVAVCEHLMDVAVVHSDVPGQNWFGTLHGPGANHVAGPWNPQLRAEGLALFAQLTGNPEAEAAFLGVADYCVRMEAGRSGPNVRHWAGPFSTIVAAYRETGEIPMLEAGNQRMAGMLARVDHRRGTWNDWHATSTYPGNIPWMDAQLALPLYTWYRQTGDVEAAQLLVGLAESMICENTPWEEPGAMRTYSPDPHFPDTTAYDPFIIPMLLAAYELTEDTFFRDAARAQWKRWLAQPEFQSVYNLSWHMPWLGSLAETLTDSPSPPEQAPDKS